MIFCTVGTQLPFDRLLGSVDNLAIMYSDKRFYGQIGDSKYLPHNFEWIRSLDETSYHQILKEAELIIGHAGMGTILTAFEYGIPVIIIPRLLEFGEHRNDHQLSTIKKFSNRDGVFACEDINDLETVFADALSYTRKKHANNDSCINFSRKLMSIVDSLKVKK
jgi:UDP-N-acetylglucosamine transferase subunit ALG13